MLVTPLLLPMMTAVDERNNYRTHLIRLMKDHPILWNKTDNEFSDRLEKSKTWKRIAAELKVPREKVRRTWDNLRDQYRRDYKRYLQTGIRPKWQFYEAMHFIQPMVRIQNLGTNAIIAKQADDDNTGGDDDDDDDDDSRFMPAQFLANEMHDGDGGDVEIYDGMEQQRIDGAEDGGGGDGGGGGGDGTPLIEMTDGNRPKRILRQRKRPVPRCDSDENRDSQETPEPNNLSDPSFSNITGIVPESMLTICMPPGTEYGDVKPEIDVDNLSYGTAANATGDKHVAIEMPVKRRRRNAPPHQQLLHEEDQPQQQHQQQQHQQHQQPQQHQHENSLEPNPSYGGAEVSDEDYHFVMSILPSLRRISGTARKLNVRMQFLNLISAALIEEANELNQN